LISQLNRILSEFFQISSSPAWAPNFFTSLPAARTYLLRGPNMFPREIRINHALMPPVHAPQKAYARLHLLAPRSSSSHRMRRNRLPPLAVGPALVTMRGANPASNLCSGWLLSVHTTRLWRRWPRTKSTHAHKGVRFHRNCSILFPSATITFEPERPKLPHSFLPRQGTNNFPCSLPLRKHSLSLVPARRRRQRTISSATSMAGQASDTGKCAAS
jgi:hypothetical protein